jgi:NAD(P)-dependent dehydrogenase (short-subunit alcohol dehydrogenase family)
MARWLAARGAETLILSGRRPPETDALAVIEGIRRAGVRVETRVADTGVREQVRALLESCGPLCGIVHLAGALDDGVLASQTPERFENVFASKARGAMYLHEMVGDRLRHFILFSSAAALLGSPAQGNYAAANAALDSLANHRASLGLPALAIGWGAWANKGMAARAESGGRRAMSLLQSVNPSEYLAELDAALAGSYSNIALLRASWTEWGAMPGRSRVEVASIRSAAAASPKVTPPSIGEELARLPESRRRKRALDFLRSQTVRILGLSDSHTLHEDEPLMRMGLDSLMALELRNTLARAFNRPLPATLLFDHPCLGALVDYLAPIDGQTPSVAGDELLETISALSDEESEELLAKELGAGGVGS